MSEKPLIEIAELTAEGPGIGKMSIPIFAHSLISIFPGSETAGVPASETNDTIFFFFRISITFSKFLLSLNLWFEIIFLLIYLILNAFHNKFYMYRIWYLLLQYK